MLGTVGLGTASVVGGGTVGGAVVTSGSVTGSDVEVSGAVVTSGSVTGSDVEAGGAVVAFDETVVGSVTGSAMSWLSCSHFSRAILYAFMLALHLLGHLPLTLFVVTHNAHGVHSPLPSQ
jgi:hypothetical protein